VKFQGSAGATALIGAQALVDGEWHLAVETTAAKVACPECGSRATGHGRRRIKVRDLPVSGRPVVLCWAKRLWRCVDADCSKATWTEQSAQLKPGGLLTVRAGAEICRLVGAEGMSVAGAARAFGVAWATAMGCVRRHGQPLVDNPARLATTSSLGVDETLFQHANARRRSRFVTGFVDLDRRLLLDVVAGRSGKVVTDWLKARPGDWLAGVTGAAIDAFRGYATALASGLPSATLVMDCFHAVALANRCVVLL